MFILFPLYLVEGIVRLPFFSKCGEGLPQLLLHSLDLLFDSLSKVDHDLLLYPRLTSFSYLAHSFLVLILLQYPKLTRVIVLHSKHLLVVVPIVELFKVSILGFLYWMPQNSNIELHLLLLDVEPPFSEYILDLFEVILLDKVAPAVIEAPYHKVASFLKDHFKAANDCLWDSHDPSLVFVDFVAVVDQASLDEVDDRDLIELLQNRLFWLQFDR